MARRVGRSRSITMSERCVITRLSQKYSSHTEAFEAWIPRVGIRTMKTASRFAEMRSGGVTKVEVIGSGLRSDCKICRAPDGKRHSIDALPVLPPRMIQVPALVQVRNYRQE